MSKPSKRNCLMAGSIVAFLSFNLLLVGMGIVLGNKIIIENIIAFAIFSILAGAVTSLLMSFEFKFVYISFLVGLTVGFLLMYRVFLQDISGWNDLIGLISMLLFTIISLGVGIFAQLGYHLFKKYKS